VDELQTNAIAAADLDRRTVDGLLTTTRAVRRRLDYDRPVERQVVEACLEIAIQAPSGGNDQPWRWVLVDDEDARRAIAAIYADCWARYRRWQEKRLATLDAAGAQALGRLLASGDSLAENLERAPVMVLPCTAATMTEQPSLLEMTSTFASIYPAVWSFQLALRSRGLGTVLTTMHLRRAADVAEVLGLPDTLLQCGLLPVAYTRGTSFRPALRQDLGAIAAWNHAPEG
jgi:nitroreductase